MIGNFYGNKYVFEEKYERKKITNTLCKHKTLIVIEKEMDKYIFVEFFAR